MRRSRLSLVLSLLILTTLAAWAGPKVALVRPLKGAASLDGKALTKPTLAEEGQVLRVEAGAQVRIQLLGGNSERLLSGAETITLSKSALLQKARALDRGEVAVAEGMGNVNRGAVGKTRKSWDRLVEVPQPRGIRFADAPVQHEGSWLWLFEVTPGSPASQAGSTTQGGTIVVGRYSDTAEELIAREFHAFSDLFPDLWEKGGQAVLEMPGVSLEPGQRYYLKVVLGTQASNGYVRDFQLLTSEESQLLQTMEKELRTRAQKQGSVVPLLEFAELLLEFGQSPLAEAVLKEAYERLDGHTEKEVRDQVMRARATARKALDLGPFQ